MRDSVVVDFDGTLVRENSSRILEEVLFSAYRGPRRTPVGWIFFGSGQPMVKVATGLLRRLTRRNIDWRFVIFLRALGSTPSILLPIVIDDAAGRLTLNTELMDSLAGVQDVAVISCGVAPVIERFSENHTPQLTLLAASGFSESAKGVWRAELLAPSDKIPYLIGHHSRSYITDDAHEADLVAAAFNEADDGSFSVRRVRDLFEVSASTQNL